MTVESLQSSAPLLRCTNPKRQLRARTFHFLSIGAIERRRLSASSYLQRLTRCFLPRRDKSFAILTLSATKDPLSVEMRGKKLDVCHNCRQHKIGVWFLLSSLEPTRLTFSQCDGLKPACSQCRFIGRDCQGYAQDLQVVFHHKPSVRRPRSARKTDGHRSRDVQRTKSSNLTPVPSLSNEQQLTYDECVAILVQHYIPKEERPFLLCLAPSKSRICGGWVQALAHVNHDHADFDAIILPAVRAFTMSMLVTGTSRQQEYLDTYGSALQGIRSVLDGYIGPVGSTVAIAGMCLALSEVCSPLRILRVSHADLS